MNLSGKVAVITGAGTGIGKGVAAALAASGAKVVISYNSSDAGARDTQQKIDALGGQSIIVKANVSVKQEIEHLMREAAGHFGGIDILVNNAALQLNYNLYGHDDDSYDRTMNTNLKGYWQCIQAVIPYMKARGSGRIINMSSVHGKRPTDFDTVYSMSKGAIKMLGRESAIELAKYGITVNTIEPGYIDVERMGGNDTKPPTRAEAAEQMKHRSPAMQKKFPLGRVGLPSDIGSLVCYIASEESEFMTGACIRVDGASILL